MLRIPLDTIRKALKVEIADDDAELARLVAAAESYAERYTGMALRVTEATLWLKAFPAEPVTLDQGPFLSVESVSYADLAGAPQTLAAELYRVDRSDGPLARIAFDSTCPAAEDFSIAIVYQVGYAELPWDLQQALVALVGAWYANPEANSPVQLHRVPFSAQCVLDQYRIRGAAR